MRDTVPASYRVQMQLRRIARSIFVTWAVGEGRQEKKVEILPPFSISRSGIALLIKFTHFLFHS